MELLISGGTVVTMDGGRRVLPKGDVLIEGQRIKKVAPRIPAGKAPRRVIDAEGRVVIPGFVQAHVHLCQTLFRNRADGFELLDWLRERIWPYEAALDESSMRTSALLGICELLEGGTTCVQDMGTVRMHEVVFEAALEAGIRYTGGKAMMDAGQGLPAGLRETTRQSLDESSRLCDVFHGRAEGRLRYAYAPRFALSCTEELLRETARLARKRAARIHTHASENSSECEAVRARTGRDNVDYLHELGLTGKDASFAHCVWLSAREQRLLAETGTHVVHCPSSNLKLASGVAKVPELLEARVGVCLGADGAPCNNNLDMFAEMRLASLIHKPRVGPTAMPASAVFEMATLSGARALGLEDEIGSLEPGKRADLAILDLGSCHSSPGGEDLYGRIVHSGKASDVKTVLVDGEVLVHEGRLLRLDSRQIAATAERQALAIHKRIS